MQRRGSEVRQRTVIVRKGERLTPQRIGMAMALGLAEAEVVKSPRLALVAPGDELLPPGAALEPGKKWCSNLYALVARAQALGCVSVNLGIVSDTPEALTEALRQGLSEDVVVILGASGRGAHDFAGQAMANIGAELCFRGVAIAPGRSMAVAQQQRTLIFGLPGSPWASFLTFEVMVRPVLQAMLLQRPTPLVPAMLAGAVHVRPGTTHLLPVRLQRGRTGWEAAPLRTLLSVAQAESDALGVLVVPPHRRSLPCHSRVRIQPL
jgi:molybdopterin molybdotransferase